MRHYEDSVKVSASPAEIFAFVDDFRRFSSHMSKSSWMMGGGTMDISLDEGQGKTVGSRVRMGGRIFGIRLYLEEVVTEHEPPRTKAWKTIGTPKLLVIGHYQMRLSIQSLEKTFSLLRISIDYELPTRNVWMGKLFGQMYAKWCVQQMVQGVRKQFT
jgi:hypothetical protein